MLDSKERKFADDILRIYPSKVILESMSKEEGWLEETKVYILTKIMGRVVEDIETRV